MMTKQLFGTALAFFAAFALLSTPAHAKKDLVSKTFKGKIIISDDELPAPDLENAKGTIKAYRAQALKTITGNVVDGVATWNFNFTAFFKTKPRSSSLALEFYTDDKEKLFVADKRLNGADTNLMILASSVRISEDENLNRNRKYVVKLVSNAGKKTVVLAETKIATK
jgi:hypothetical protein